MSTRRCGTPCGSRDASFAVPTSKYRYTWRESQFTISARRLLARDRARAVLPEPVGPTMAINGEGIIQTVRILGCEAILKLDKESNRSQKSEVRSKKETETSLAL